MATAEKLREGLFSISWAVSNNAVLNGQQAEVLVTNLPDVFEFCQLNYSIIGQQKSLKVKFVLSKTSKPIKLETISILAINDGIKQKMILINQKERTAEWTAEAKGGWCHYCRSNSKTFFDILIDLTPNLEFAMTKGEKRVVEHNLNLWKTKTLADVTFRCKDGEIKAHVMIVVSCSPVLAAMFTNDFKENREKVVNINDIRHGTFSRLLLFMYTGDASLNSNVPTEKISELLIAAEKYGVETLKEDCALHLSCNLNVENASHCLVLAHLYNSSILLESTFEFISKNAKAVCSRKEWMEIIKNYPELCFQATQLMFGL